MIRRLFLLGCLTVSFACADDPRELPPQLISWNKSSQQTVADQPTEQLEFMVAPWLASNELIELYKPLLNDLSQFINRPVRLNIAPDYPTLLKLVRRGKIDIAQLNARSFQTLLEEKGTYRYIGTVAHLNAHQEPIYGAKGLLVSTSDKELNARSAKSLRMGLIDKRSTSGFLLPTLWFRANGFEVESFKEVFFLGSHTKAFTALLNGRVDVIASWDGQLTLEGPRINGRIRQTIETGRLPNDAWVVAGARKESLAAELLQWAAQLPSALKAPDLFPTERAFAGLKRIEYRVYQELPSLPD